MFMCVGVGERACGHARASVCVFAPSLSRSLSFSPSLSLGVWLCVHVGLLVSV